MASAKRPSRTSSRTSSPFPLQPNGLVSQQNDPQPQKRNPKVNGWTEPPLRPPVPSFMDHKGLERQGVLEQMMALGTFPTARVKARSRGDPVRRTVQAQNVGEDMMVDDAAATPEIAIPMAEHTKAAYATTEDPALSAGRTLPVNTQRAGTQAPAQVSMGAEQRSPTTIDSLLLTPLPGTRTYSSSSARSDNTIERAVERASIVAARRRQPAIEENLAHLQSAALQDPEFAQLLAFAVTNNSLHERGSAVNRKLKQLKSTLRSQSSSPHSQQGSITGGVVSHPNKNWSKSPSQSNYRTIAPATNKDGHTIRTSTPSISPSPQHPFAQKMAAHPNNVHAKNDVTDVNIGNEARPSPSRRSSTSSLSSVDEGVAAGPPPSLQPPQQNLKRSSTRAEFLLDEDDIEVEAKRKRLRKSFDDVTIVESNVRRLSARKTTGSDTPRSFKLKLNYQTDGRREHGHQSNLASASPASEIIAGGPVAGSKRPSTPTAPTALGRPPKRLKTAAKVKISPQKNQQPAVSAGIARHDSRRQGSVAFDENKSEQSENNDYCSSCGGTGFLLCCDGCDRSFHFTCLDPPLNQDAALDEPWFCHMCQGERALSGTSHGLFGDLQCRVEKKNPSAFNLPWYIRDYFEGVKTGENGEYTEAVTQRTSNVRGRAGYDEAPDFKRLSDAKGKVILCYQCGKSSLGQRDIIPCDYCAAHWHLDCLHPPLANPPNRGQNGKTRPPWMCPLHSDQDLRNLDPLEQIGVRFEGTGRTHRVRRPKKATVVQPALRRGFANNGLIEIASDASDHEVEFEEEEAPDGVIYKLPAEGVRLDFIDKVKSNRLSATQAAIENCAKIALKTAHLEYINQRKLSQDLTERRMAERTAVLNLVQFATQNSDLEIGSTEMEKLIYTLEAEATADVVASITEGESGATAAVASKKNAREPPSPPASYDQADSLKVESISARERQVLLKLQEYISRRLEGGARKEMTNGT